MQLELSQIEVIILQTALRKDIGYARTYQGGFGVDKAQVLMDKLNELRLAE